MRCPVCSCSRQRSAVAALGFATMMVVGYEHSLADTLNWKHTVGNNWSVASCWSLGQVPASTDSATISSGSSITRSFNEDHFAPCGLATMQLGSTSGAMLTFTQRSRG
jgi:hypothetical protein